MMVTTLIETKLGEIPEDWGVITIGECCVILDSQRVPLSAEVRRAMKGDYPYYGANGQVDSIDKWIFDEPLILMAEDGGYFDDFRNRPIAYKVTSKCWVNNHAHVLKPKQAYWFDWVFYQLEHMNIIPYINGSTRTKLNQQELAQIRLPVAPLPEQRRITEILTTIDETIEKTDAIIWETQQLKRGLMQKLFTEGIGHTQFKETKIGQIPEEWIVTKLESVSEFITKGATPTTYGFEWVSKGIPFLRSECVGEEGFTLSGAMFISQTAHEAMKRSQIKGGDILITITGYVGRAVQYPRNMPEGNINQHIARVRINRPDTVLPEFICQSLSRNTVRQYYGRIITGAAYPQLSLKQIRETPIPVPPLTEQNKIIQILSEVDTKIETEKAFKSELEQLKKGLMQVLLTGKIRVKV